MFYIDFTTPEGKTYRIDLSKHKLIHSCPVCGSEQQIMLDESLELFFQKTLRKSSIPKGFLLYCFHS